MQPQLNTTDINKESRFWVATWNNYPKQFTELPEGLTYLVSGEEVGQDGTPHLQMYFELSRSRRRSYVSKLFPKCWLQIRHGTAEHAIEYAKKDGKWVEFGVPAEKTNKPGKRNDLVQICEKIQNGKSLKSVAEEHSATFIRNYRGITLWKAIVKEPSPFRENLQIWLFVGKTRLGKSYHARVALDCWPKPIGKGLWFDGYDGQKRVVIDEFRGQYPLSDVLQLTDPYKVQVETKGGHVWFEPELIVFTTNTNPREMYQDHDEATREAFLARFHRVFYWYAKQKFVEMSEIQKKAYFDHNTIPVIPITPQRLVNDVLVQPPAPLKRKRSVIDLVEEENERRPPYRWDPKAKKVVKNVEKQKKMDDFIPSTPWQSIEDTQPYSSDLESDDDSLESHVSDTELSSILSDDEVSF